jgi:prepilin signal peptidase PulO-like enzyme (type II secretory pathway)
MMILYFILGTIFGSFLNAWIWRTRERTSVVRGRSRCPSCKTQLQWYENIPLISFVLQKGRCSSCKERISWQYPLVELAMGVLFAGISLFHGYDTILSVRDMCIAFFLMFVWVYDVRYQEIWDRMTVWPALGLALATAIFQWHSWQSMTIGILVGGGFFLLQYVVSKGTWVGGGDIRLGMFMGVILGWPLILVALLLAYVGGTLFVLPFLIAGKKQLAGKIPFGAYLSVATVVMMFWGERLVDWYIGLLT